MRRTSQTGLHGVRRETTLDTMSAVRVDSNNASGALSVEFRELILRRPERIVVQTAR